MSLFGLKKIHQRENKRGCEILAMTHVESNISK